MTRGIHVLARCLAMAGLMLGLSAPVSASTAEDQVRTMLATQQLAWNRGDIDGFMQFYMRNESLRFASGDRVRLGWQATLDGYKRGYADAAKMGQLDYSLIEVKEFSADMVYVFGRWHLARANESESDAPRGLFTLIVERKDGEWVITRDHTSAADK
ncbi:nuclear transport factor 2 family protein [Burkholderiaceae bacterium DAT-1]|nr:nuclear transport factor 2 family protein [Burkholderiaceae bacterium DAT-1]